MADSEYQGQERRHDIGEWREGVTVSLARIQDQMGRIASDRESEKGTMQRMGVLCDTRYELARKDLLEHARFDTDRHQIAMEKIAAIDKRLTLIVGIGTGMQTLVVLGLAAAKFLGVGHA